MQNQSHIQKIQAQRERDAQEGNRANPECVKNLKDIGELEKALDHAREQNRADLQNTRKLKATKEDTEGHQRTLKPLRLKRSL